MTYIGIIVSFIFINNIILDQLLVGKSFLDVTRNTRAAVSFGIILICVSAISCFFTWTVYHGLLKPVNLEYLQTLLFIIVVTSLTLIIEFLLDKIFPALHRYIKEFFPLVAANCAVLGISLISVRSGYTAGESFAAGGAAGAGYFLAIILLSAIQESSKREWVPRPFQGIPVTLISAGLMALAFMAFDNALLKNLIG